MAVDPGLPPRGGARLQSRPNLSPEPPPPPDEPDTGRKPSEWTAPVLGLYTLMVVALASSSFLGTWQFMESIDKKDLAVRLSSTEDRLASQRNEIQQLTDEHKRLMQRLAQMETAPQPSGATAPAPAASGFRLLVNGEELTLEQVATRLGATAGATDHVPDKPSEDAGD